MRACAWDYPRPLPDRPTSGRMKPWEAGDPARSAKSSASVGSPGCEVKRARTPSWRTNCGHRTTSLYDAAMVPGVILAGGASSRMGSPKALLADDRGQPFVVRLVRAMAEAGLSDLVVVTGYEHDSIVAALAAQVMPRVRVVRNEDPARGQLSSLWTAMDEVCGPETEAFAVMLVDVPLVTPETIRTVVDAWKRSRAPIVRPAVGPRRGHPVAFERAVFDGLCPVPLDVGARAVVRAHERDILDVPVADTGCLKDIDTRDDYETYVRKDS